MQRLLLVCLGGALGSGARYLVGLLAARLLGVGFPWGTLLVNLVGCFLISAIFAVGTEAAPLSPALRLFLTTGIMGGLTTYSAFNHELLQLVEQGFWMRAGSYLLVTLIGCLSAGGIGILCGRWLRIFS
jgi:CrcB protein